jgi:hypothetical protein
VRQLKADFCDLAERASHILIAIQDQIYSTENFVTSPVFEDNLAVLVKSVLLLATNFVNHWDIVRWKALPSL